MAVLSTLRHTYHLSPLEKRLLQRRGIYDTPTPPVSREVGRAIIVDLFGKGKTSLVSPEQDKNDNERRMKETQPAHGCRKVNDYPTTSCIEQYQTTPVTPPKNDGLRCVDHCLRRQNDSCDYLGHGRANFNKEICRAPSNTSG